MKALLDRVRNELKIGSSCDLKWARLSMKDIDRLLRIVEVQKEALNFYATAGGERAIEARAKAEKIAREE